MNQFCSTGYVAVLCWQGFNEFDQSKIQMQATKCDLRGCFVAVIGSTADRKMMNGWYQAKLVFVVWILTGLAEVIFEGSFIG